MLDSGAEGPGFKLQPWRCLVTVLGKLFTPIIHQAAKLVAALLRVAMVTVGLAERNGSLSLGLWLASSAGWLPRTGISSRTLCSVMEYGLPFTIHLCIHAYMSVLCGTVLVGLRVTDVTLVVPFYVKNVITRWQQSNPLGSSTGQGGQCLFSYNCLVDCVMVSDNLSAVRDELFAFSALTLLVGWKERASGL